MVHDVSTSWALGGVFISALAALFALGAFVFWLWMLIHAIQNRGLNDSERIVWVLVIIFLNFLGALLYLIVGKPKTSGIHAGG